MDADALFQAGRALQDRGTPADLPEIERLYREAAEAGSTLGMAHVGLLAEGVVQAQLEDNATGEGLFDYYDKGDLEQAADWYRKASRVAPADHGSSFAGFLMGRLYAERHGNWPKAQEWYTWAVAVGFGRAQEALTKGPEGAAQSVADAAYQRTLRGRVSDDGVIAAARRARQTSYEQHAERLRKSLVRAA